MVQTEINVYNKKITLKTYGQEDHISRIIQTSKQFYESSLLDFLYKNYKGGVWLDIGANIGNHTVFFGSFCADKVISVEMLPANVTLLKENIRLNNLEDKVTVYEGGMGGELIEYNLPSTSNMGMATVTTNGEFTANTVTPNDFNIKVFESIKLIKIDCEDSTYDILLQLDGLITKYNPYLVIELDGKLLDDWCRAKKYEKVRKFNATTTWLLKKI